MKIFQFAALVICLAFMTACGGNAPASPESNEPADQAAAAEEQSATVPDEAKLKDLYFEWTRISIQLAAGGGSPDDIRQQATEAVNSFKAKHNLSDAQFQEMMRLAMEKDWAKDFILQGQ